MQLHEKSVQSTLYLNLQATLELLRYKQHFENFVSRKNKQHFRIPQL